MKKLFLLVLATFMLSCSNREVHTYEVIHHKNVCDTIVTSRYTFYLENKAIDAKEGGCFTEVVQIKRID